MKKLLFIFLVFTIQGYSQSLTIDETLSFLNKLSAEHPGKYSVKEIEGCKTEFIYSIKYDYKSKLSIQEIQNTFNCSNHWHNFINRSLFTVDLVDFDISGMEIRMDKYGNRVALEGDFELVESERSEGKGFFELGSYASIQIRVYHKDYLRVYLNGLKYLFSLAKEQIPKEKFEIFDPFLNKKTETKTDKANFDSKVTLSFENGVTHLSVLLGGKISSKFTLDTGAGECNISSELEKKLIANGVIRRNDYLPNGLYKLADGSIIENRRVKISKMKIGNKNIVNVIVSVGSSNSPNLLGQSFLGKLDKWSIDNLKKLLIIQ